jgi:hypothetical protein
LESPVSEPVIRIALVDERLRALDAEESGLRVRLAAIGAERNVLTALKRDATQQRITKPARATEVPQVTATDVPAVGWRRAILDYIGKHRNLQLRALTDALETAGFCNNSKNPRKTIQTIIGQLVTDGKLVRSEEGIRVT